MDHYIREEIQNYAKNISPQDFTKETSNVNRSTFRTDTHRTTACYDKTTKFDSINAHYMITETQHHMRT